MVLTMELITLGILVLDIALFSVLIVRTITNMYTRGARSLLLLLAVLQFVLLFHIGTIIVQEPETRIYLFTFQLFFFLLVPITWSVLAYELTGYDTRRSWKLIGPMFIVNFLFYSYLQSLRDPGPPAYTFHSCETTGSITNCVGEFTLILYVFLAMILLEILAGAIYLIWYYFRDPNVKNRIQILATAVAALAAPVVAGTIFLIFRASGLSPIPVAFLVMGVFFFNAVFNPKIMTLRFSDESKLAMVDDLMIAIDDEHIIQDFNLATLNAFGLQVQNLVNVRIEHALYRYPEIVELFQHIGNDSVKLNLGGVEHEFKPSVVNIVAPDTNEIIGKRLQLHDITQRTREEDTTSITRDRLTNQYTKETFYALGIKLFNNAKRLRQPISMVVIDIDDFQNVNNRYTWVVGDEALVQLVEVIHKVIRTSDLLARFDSDNFVLLLTHADENTAYQICTRIKDAVATNIFESDGQEFQFTISQGYAVYDGTMEASLEGFYETARTALMQSRNQGRNRLASRSLRKG